MTAPAEPPVLTDPPVPAPPAPTPAVPVLDPPEPSAAPGAEPDTFDRAYVERLRKEAADRRTAATTATEAATAAHAERDAHAAKLTELQAVLDAITKAVTGKDDEPADPAKLTAQLVAEKAQREADLAALTAAKDGEIRALTIRATLPVVATQLGAHPALVQAVLSADGTLARLDPASDTYTADLESAVQAALETHPQLKVAPVVARSGAEIPGRSGGSDQLTLEQVRAMKPEDIDKARKAGRLTNLGFGAQ